MFIFFVYSKSNLTKVSILIILTNTYLIVFVSEDYIIVAILVNQVIGMPLGITSSILLTDRPWAAWGSYQVGW